MTTKFCPDCGKDHVCVPPTGEPAYVPNPPFTITPFSPGGGTNQTVPIIYCSVCGVMHSTPVCGTTISVHNS